MYRHPLSRNRGCSVKPAGGLSKHARLARVSARIAVPPYVGANKAAERAVAWKPGRSSPSSTQTRAVDASSYAIDAPTIPAPTTIKSYIIWRHSASENLSISREKFSQKAKHT